MTSLLTRPETHSHPPWWKIPRDPVATGARTTHHPAGPCRVCRRATLPGDRVADLPTGGVIHVYCAGKIR